MSLRAKTQRRMIVFLTCAAMLGGSAVAAYFARLHFLERRAQISLATGMKALANGDYPAALSGIGGYLRRHPDDVKSLLDYAQARIHVELPNGRQYTDCISVYQRVLNLQPDNQQAAQSMLEIYETIQYDVEALQLASEMLQRDPANTAALKAEAVSYYRQRSFADAVKASLAYNQLKPDDLEAQVFTLQILSQTAGGAQKILDRADQLRKAQPANVRCLLLQSMACTLTHDDAGAVKWLEEALRHNPSDAPTVLMLVSQCDTVALEADVIATDAADIENQALALLQTQADRLHDPSLSAKLASRLWQLDRFQDVVDHFPTAQRDDPVELLAMRCLSFHSLGRDADAAAAEAILQQAAHDHHLAKLWDTLVNQMLSSSQTDDGATITACRQALTDDPTNPYFHYFLGELYARVDEPDAAMQEWQSAANYAPSWAAPTIRVAEMMLNSGRFDDAVAAAELAARRSPQSRSAQLVLIAALSTKLQPGDGAGADVLLGQLQKLPPSQRDGDSDVIPLSAEIQFRAGRRDAVVQIIQSALAAKPPPLVSTFLRLAAVSQQMNLGLDGQCFDAATRAYGPTPEVALAQATVLRRAGNAQEGLELLRSARAAAAGNPSESASQIESWDVAWTRYLDSIADPGARQAWIDLTHQNEKDAAIQWLALGAQSVKWDRPFIGLILDRLKAQLGDQGVEWRLARAKYLLDDSPGDDDCLEAALLLGGITQEEPNLLEARLLLARCRYEMHDTPRAIEQLTRAAEIAPQDPGIALDLARMLQEGGNFSEARKYTDRLAQMPSLTPDQRSSAANLMSNEGDRSAAIAMLESLNTAATQPSKGDENHQLMLAQLYFQTGQSDKLKALCGQLLLSRDPRALGLVAEIYAAGGREAESETILKQLDALQVAPDVKQLILGSHAMRLGQLDRAAEYFRQATLANPANPQAWTALIKTQLQQLAPDAALNSARAAARSLPGNPVFPAVVTTLAADGSLVPRWPEIGNMICALLMTSGQEVDSQASDVAAVCQAITQGEADHVTAKQLAGTLRELADKDRELAGLQVLAGRLELLIGDSDRAAALAMRAMQDFPSDPGPAALAVRAWAAQGQWNEALQAAQQWHDRAPEMQLPADQAIADGQEHLNNPDEALNRLAPYLDRAKADPDHFADLLLQVAEIQIRGGHSDLAAALLRPALAKSAPVRIDWIKLAGALDPPDREAQWLGEVEPNIPSDSAADRLTLAEQWQLLANRSSSAQYRQKAVDEVKQFVEQCAAHANANELLLLGSLQENQGDVAGAQASYRAVLQLQPNALIAQNNLAMLLAKSDHLDEALVYAQQAAQADSPYQADCQQTLAYVQDRLGRHNDAIQTLNSALKISPNHIPSLIELSGIYAATGQLDQARTILQQLDQIAPDPKSLSADQQAKLASLHASLSQ